MQVGSGAWTERCTHTQGTSTSIIDHALPFVFVIDDVQGRMVGGVCPRSYVPPRTRSSQLQLRQQQEGAAGARQEPKP